MRRRMARLWGWGAQRRVECDERFPESSADAKASIDRAGTIARGLGRSYGDQALNEHRRVLTLTRLNRYLSFDEATATLRCEAGVTLAEIIRDFAPRGFFPAITPGTKLVTVGGCIANDVHGKAHHAQGSFVTSVESLRILLGDGAIVQASRTENADLFWATFGGLGLVGLVLDATLVLRKVETTYFRQKSFVARDLTQLLELLDEHDAAFPYTVATLDATATGARLGTGVVTVGDHARRDELPRELADRPLRLAPPRAIPVPFELPELVVNPLTIRVVNTAIAALLRSKGAFELYEGFVYPLDMFHAWNRAFGRRGFIQYQFVLPPEPGGAALRRLLEAIVTSGQLPWLNVLKRMGPANDAPLSFPMAGTTFAIDFPVRDGLFEVTERLDAMVLDAGGRIYLGKDSCLNAAMLRRMYPKLGQWLAVKQKWDPDGVFTSDLGRRLELSR